MNKKTKLLSKADVMNSVCQHLEEQGWAIISRATNNPKGLNIEVTRGTATHHIETLGDCSDKESENYFRTAFSVSDYRKKFAVSFLKLLIIRACPMSAGLALSNCEFHREHMAAIQPLPYLDITVYWVGGDGTVVVGRL